MRRYREPIIMPDKTDFEYWNKILNVEEMSISNLISPKKNFLQMYQPRKSNIHK